MGNDNAREQASPCQIHDVSVLALPLPPWQAALQLGNRIRRVVKRRRTYLVNLLAELTNGVASSRTPVLSAAAALNAGDAVRVRSREEIQQSLNRWNQLKGCSFMEEMERYCGTRQRIFKRVERFLDERDYRSKRCRGIYLLDGVLCEGTRDFGPCDRSCFFFWREEWLERLPDDPPVTTPDRA
jgi:hypothetical protein